MKLLVSQGILVTVLALLLIPNSRLWALDHAKPSSTDPLLEAIYEGNHQAIRVVLRETNSLNLQAAARLAAEYRQLETLESLIEEGAKANLEVLFASLLPVPKEVQSAHTEAGTTIPDTFSYLFWKKGMFVGALALLALPAASLWLIWRLRRRALFPRDPRFSDPPQFEVVQ